jgi:hypothetical protein
MILTIYLRTEKKTKHQETMQTEDTKRLVTEEIEMLRVVLFLVASRKRIS